MTHMTIANSTVMAMLCGITILIVLLQPLLFTLVALKRGKELGIEKGELKTAAKSSAIFSIIPSLPILISYLLLVPFLGRFFPWLRLSVVGSAVYETMAAMFVAGGSALLFGVFASKHEKLKEFAFPLSMVIGMLASCVVSAVL